MVTDTSRFSPLLDVLSKRVCISVANSNPCSHVPSVHATRVHQQFPAFSTGARLCKRWVAAQLLSNHISDEALDLMVAYLFVSPAPYLSPGSPLTAFLRFLSLLVCFDWLSEPLVVNFNNELSSE